MLVFRKRVTELSIIVPCVSTIEPLSAFIDEVASYLMENPSDTTLIIVVNEQSGDPTPIIEYVKKQYPWLRFEMLQRSGGARSFGALARFGIAFATSRFVVLVSPYGQDDVKIISTMLQKIRGGAQVVQATRYASAQDAKTVSRKFRFYQFVYRRLTKALLGWTITDSTYEFKMFDRPFIQALGLIQNGYSISPEITLKALLAGGRVDYIPSSPRISPIDGNFKLRKEGIGYCWLLVRGWAHQRGILWF